MKYYLIQFDYFSDAGADQKVVSKTMLINARSFMKACSMIIEQHSSARNFKNLTIH